jgi:sulfofructose kinase
VAGAERLFALAAARGLPRVLDADIAPRETLRRLVAQADHVVFSQRGLAEFAATADPAAGLAMAAAAAPGRVAVTLGAGGSLWWRDDRAWHLPAPPVQARDTTGCGDVFHGAYALAIAEGAALPTAARFATAAGALKAARGDGWAGMPDRAAVAALIAQGWG